MTPNNTKKTQKADPKGEFLQELIDLRNKWVMRPEKEAREFVSSYERMIAAYTVPEENGK